MPILTMAGREQALWATSLATSKLLDSLPVADGGAERSCFDQAELDA